jgi:hypothetical protein
MWELGIAGLGISLTDGGEWILAGGNHFDFPLSFNFESNMSLFGDSLRYCSTSLWWKHVQLEETMWGLVWSWRSESFSMEAKCYFQEFFREVCEMDSPLEQLMEGLTEFLQYDVALPFSSIDKTFYVSPSPDSELRGGCFTSSRVVWNPCIMFSISRV